METVTAGLCSACAVFSLVASLLTADYSWCVLDEHGHRSVERAFKQQAPALNDFLLSLRVDRLWSLTPWWYVWIFAYFSGFHPRLVLCGVVSAIWGLRLSYNFARKGGYSVGDEDYRWANIQKDLKKLAPKYHRHLWLVRGARWATTPGLRLAAAESFLGVRRRMVTSR